jgi:pimeloyl-ACP methyl ester carboxylesterase
MPDSIEATVSLNGIFLFYELRGAGPPLLLLHGGTGCHSDWAYSGREQFEREYRLILPDARGHGSSKIHGNISQEQETAGPSTRAQNTAHSLGMTPEGVSEDPRLAQLKGESGPQDLYKTLTHRQCALDTLALLDHLGIERCKAVGISMGGNILLHMATMQPERIETMVVVSATMYFPEQARKIMAAVPAPENQPQSEWDRMRRAHSRGPQRAPGLGSEGCEHKLGDEQIVALWQWAHSLKDSYDDMNFSPENLAAIKARTLVVYGDRDPLYPVEMGVAMYRAIPNSALWVVPGGGHGPVFFGDAEEFAKRALAFLR